MSSYVNGFLSTELTCIPKIIDKYIGDYYSNKAGNALTWLFVFWIILHYLFDELLDILLIKIKIKEHQRKRLIKAVWYCGFYGTSFFYCIATTLKTTGSISEYGSNLLVDGGPIAPHVVLGLGLFGTFFCHSAIWDLLKHKADYSIISYLLLTLIQLCIYITRRVELCLTLMALISLYQFNYNILRCLTIYIKDLTEFTKYLLKFALHTCMGIFAVIHILIIPLFFIAPLMYTSFNMTHSASVIFLIILLLAWWTTEILANPLYKFANNWMNHRPTDVVCDSIIEFTLFPERDDFEFNLNLARNEIKEREAKLISKRKPKNRGLLIQTLKCMVAIKRKINQQRKSENSSESSESESERENAEKDSGSDEEETDTEEEEENLDEEVTNDDASKVLIEEIVGNESVVVEDFGDNKKND